MSTLNDLRRVADEMADLSRRWQRPQSSDLQGWANIVHEFTETPRCPRCGTNVAPGLRGLFPDSTNRRLCQCVACHRQGPIADNEQDALAAFYGETTNEAD